MRPIFALLLLAFLVPLTAQASQPPATCHIYLKNNKELPREIIEILNMPYTRTEAVRECYQMGRVGYFALSYMRKGIFGVCSHNETPVFKQDDSAKYKWSFRPPGVEFPIKGETLRMALAQGECPRHDEDAYVDTSEVSEGLFVAFNRFLDGLNHESKMQDVFYQPAIEGLPNDQRFWMEARREAFMNKLRTGKGQISLRSLAARNFEAGGLRYDFSFTFPGEVWGGRADLTPDGFRIFAISGPSQH